MPIRSRVRPPTEEVAEPLRYWRVPRIWEGGDCYILGGGPSLRAVDVNRLRGHRVIAINNAFKLGDWIEVCLFRDAPWWRRYGSQVLEWPGLRVTIGREYLGIPGLKVLQHEGGLGITLDPCKLRWNVSTGGAALNLAVHLGVKRIVLLGYDMQKGATGENNWHEENRPHTKEARFDPYPRFLQAFPSIKADLERLGIKCLNATDGGCLETFPRVSLEDLLGD